MRSSRTALTITVLLAALGYAVGTPSEAGPAEAAENVPASAAPVRPVPSELRAWYADYPAATDIDGARVYAERPDAVTELRWALGRFAEAGLELPAVEVWMHDDLSGCRSVDGSLVVGYTTERAGRRVVYSCGTRFTLLHELGHVFVYEHLSDAERDAFTRTREADAWRTGEWSRSASEHAADVIAWGLHPEHVRPSRTLPNDDASLSEAFVMLTGTAPLP